MTLLAAIESGSGKLSSKDDLSQKDLFEKNLAFFQKNVPSLYEKVNIQHLLSILYRQNGEEGKYLASLRYIAENGNCLYIAKEAVKSLEEL